MNVGEIRKCFSKGSVSTSGRGITVFYTYKERWVTQSIYDDDARIFLGILDNSDRFAIDRVAGKFVKLSFHSDSMGFTDTVFYNPVEGEVSLQELEEMMFANPGESDEHDEFFIGVDLDNEDEVLERVSEWISLINERNRGNLARFMPLERWRKLKAMAENLARIFGCFVSPIDPCDDFGGAFEFTFDENVSLSTEISGEELEKLKEFISETEGFSVECLVEKGYLNITFTI